MPPSGLTLFTIDAQRVALSWLVVWRLALMPRVQSSLPR